MPCYQNMKIFKTFWKYELSKLFTLKSALFADKVRFFLTFTLVLPDHSFFILRSIAKFSSEILPGIPAFLKKLYKKILKSKKIYLIYLFCRKRAFLRGWPNIAKLVFIILTFYSLAWSLPKVHLSLMHFNVKVNK